MIHVNYSSVCAVCEWRHEGDDAASKAAAHTKRTQHATETRGEPAK